MPIEPSVQSSLISAGAEILGGAFGGDSYGRQKRMLRKQYKYALRYQPQITRADLLAKVGAAKEAGLHPLFALGAGGANTSPAFSMPGQAKTGSFAQDALRGVSRHYSRMADLEAQKELTMAQAALSATRVAERSLSNDTTAPWADRHPDLEVGSIPRQQARKFDDVVKLEPDVQRTRDSTDSSRSAARNPAWMQVEIWPGAFVDVPWSEEGFAESLENLPALALTLARNSAVGYRRVYRQLKAAHTKYYKSRAYGMRSRHPKRRTIPPKVKPRRRTSPDIFVPYSRGPHR